MDLNALTQQAVSTLMQVGLKVAGALALWLVGRWLIGLALRLLGRALAKQNFDATLARYMQTGLKALLNIVLVVALLGYFGVETTSFAALLAAGGVAIGVAWSGLLANFAAGTFLVFLRPFKVGDFVTAGGVTGTVETISSSPRQSTPRTTSSRSSATTRPSRTRSRTSRSTRTRGGPHRDRSAAPSIITKPSGSSSAGSPRSERAGDPAPDVDVLQFTPAGPVLCVRPVLQERPLLAGVLRHQPDDPRSV